VRTIEVGAAQSGVTLLAWDGLTDAGQAAAPGRYRFTVNAVQGGQKVDTTALALGVVDSVSHGAQGVALGLGEDRSAGLGDVRQVF
jgi:flagellar basal-body rod modification protein FlgD